MNKIKNHSFMRLLALISLPAAFCCLILFASFLIYSENYKEIINIFNKTNINYYYFENSENLVINFLVNENKV